MSIDQSGSFWRNSATTHLGLRSAYKIATHKEMRKDQLSAIWNATDNTKQTYSRIKKQLVLE